MHKSQQINDLLLKLLNPAASLESLPPEIENPDEIILKAVTHNVHLHVYAGLLCRRDEILKENNGLNTLFNKLKVLYLNNLPRAVRQELVQNNVVASLHREQLPAVIFRGTAIAKELYGDPYCRTASDIDILIRPSDISNVDSILQQKGYVRNDNLPLNFWLNRLHHAVYRHTDDKTLLEIHWNFSVPAFFNLSSEEIWSGVTSDDGSETKLTPEMTIIMLLVHHHLHAFRELRILTDILWAFRKYDGTVDWAPLAKEIVTRGFAKTTLITIHQIRNLWPEAAMNMHQILLLEKQIRKFRRKIPRVLFSLLTIDMDNKNTYRPIRDKLVNRFSLDTWSAIARSFLKTVLPSPDAVRVLYHTKQSWTLPFHYFRFITWRIRSLIGL